MGIPGGTGLDLWSPGTSEAVTLHTPPKGVSLLSLQLPFLTFLNERPAGPGCGEGEILQVAPGATDRCDHHKGGKRSWEAVSISPGAEGRGRGDKRQGHGREAFAREIQGLHQDSCKADGQEGGWLGGAVQETWGQVICGSKGEEEAEMTVNPEKVRDMP